MTRLLKHLLRAHVACGGRALLLWAALGAAARTRYLGMGGQRPDVLPPLGAAQAMRNPAIGDRATMGSTMRRVRFGGALAAQTARISSSSSGCRSRILSSFTSASGGLVRPFS